jgi:drug/metabolite transporter (DMT)-like permease
MLTTLTILAALFFVAHVYLLFTSFGKKGFQKQKYLWSHITLWITGALAMLIALLFAGKGVSSVIDVFNTPGKAALLSAIALVLSALAHTIVKLLVMPKYQNAA